MTIWPHALLFASAVASPASAIAQSIDPACNPVCNSSFDPSGRPLGPDRRVTVGLALPLGGGAGLARKPQLELRAVADHRAARTGAGGRDAVGGSIEAKPREVRIGLTLNQRPRLTVAGRELPEAERKLGISTVAWVGIGIATVAVVGGLLFLDRLEDSSD